MSLPDSVYVAPVSLVAPMGSILLVDDDDDSCALIALCLEREGWKVTQLSSLEAAQQALLINPVTGACAFDVLLTDLHLRDGKGTELLAAGRPRGLAAALVLSGDVVEAESAQLHGFDGALLKPFDRIALVGRIRELLSQPMPSGAHDVA